MFELGDYFPQTVVFPDFFKDYQDKLSQQDMRITRSEVFRNKIRFTNLGHLVYQLVAAPWTIPGFTVNTHLHGLKILANKLKSDGELVFSAGYYLLEARKGL